MGGHHFIWYRGFCRALLELGCQVAAFCPDPDDVKNYLASCMEAEALSRIRFFQLKVPPQPRFCFSRWRPRLQASAFASLFRTGLAELESAFGKPADLVFFACLYEHQQHLCHRAVDTIQRPWAGLNIHARSEGAPGGITMPDLLRHPRLSSVAVIDEGIAPVVERTLQKPVVVFPDFTDETWEPAHPLEQRFRRFAGNNKLIASIGHMRPNKGVGTLAQIAVDPAAKGLAFAFAGEIDWNWLGSPARDFLTQAMLNAPGAMFHMASVPDGAAYNGIVRACDVMFAAYLNFPHSSNTLTKAAVFEKPLIVSDGHLMAKRVREYRMGEIVPQDDPKATLEAVHQLTANYPAWLEKNQPRWKEYREAHSYKALLRAFSKLLGVLPG